LAAESVLDAGTTSGVLEFANGSRFDFEPRSRARLSRSAAHHTEVVLEAGRVEADVVRKPNAEWSIVAGPYLVRVVGTRFSVAWDPDEGDFAVEVTHGEVRVFGADLPADGVAVRAGGRLERREVEAPTASGLPEPDQENPSARDGAVQNDVQPVLPQQPEERLRRSERPEQAAGTSGSETATWRALAARGRYEEALKIASRQGLATWIETGSAADLLLLGNAARFAGRPDEARRLYLGLRKRHGSAPESQLAAFSLARLAADVERQPQQAIQWLRVFLRESPQGDLAASARARLMDTLAREGQRDAAAEVARDYLRHHPGGPHAEMARSLVGSPTRR
jgi:TolA-binding protein